jgi:hypothetical protein
MRLNGILSRPNNERHGLKTSQKICATTADTVREWSSQPHALPVRLYHSPPRAIAFSRIPDLILFHARASNTSPNFLETQELPQTSCRAAATRRRFLVRLFRRILPPVTRSSGAMLPPCNRPADEALLGRTRRSLSLDRIAALARVKRDRWINQSSHFTTV